MGGQIEHCKRQFHAEHVCWGSAIPIMSIWPAPMFIYHPLDHYINPAAQIAMLLHSFCAGHWSVGKECRSTDLCHVRSYHDCGWSILATLLRNADEIAQSRFGLATTHTITHFRCAETLFYKMPATRLEMLALQPPAIPPAVDTPQHSVAAELDRGQHFEPAMATAAAAPVVKVDSIANMDAMFLGPLCRRTAPSCAPWPPGYERLRPLRKPLSVIAKPCQDTRCSCCGIGSLSGRAAPLFGHLAQCGELAA
jgi:hypothetical protein